MALSDKSRFYEEVFINNDMYAIREVAKCKEVREDQTLIGIYMYNYVIAKYVKQFGYDLVLSILTDLGKWIENRESINYPDADEVTDGE